jgi:hypothetical protein
MQKALALGLVIAFGLSGSLGAQTTSSGTQQQNGNAESAPPPSEANGSGLQGNSAPQKNPATQKARKSNRKTKPTDKPVAK